MNFLEINTHDLMHNINLIKNMANSEKKDNGESLKIIAVVKGNGYGLDLVKYSQFLINNGIEFLAVATTFEAIKLRNAGIKVKILMLSSTSIKEEIESLIDNDIIITIGSKTAAQIANEIAIKKNKVVRAHLKIDTGFGRYGFIYSELEQLYEALKEMPNVQIEGTFSHFSNAYEKSTKWTNIQFDRFINVIENMKINNINPGLIHICSSVSFFKYTYMHLDAVRIGSAFLGRIPIENKGLKTIGSLTSQVAEIKELPKKYNISYLNTYKTKDKMKTAIVQVGFFEGINLKQGQDMFRFRDNLRYAYKSLKRIIKKEYIYVNVNNKRYRALGKLGMYHINIKGDNIKIGDTVKIKVNPIYVDSSVERKYV